MQGNLYLFSIGHWTFCDKLFKELNYFLFMETKPNFLERETIEEANAVDLSVYSFVKLSDAKGYVFKKRVRK